MFSQPSEKEFTKASHKQKQKSSRKKRNKQKQKNKRTAIQTKQSLANTMSSWAENFTIAATWQLKHQVAMWKSKATALEYENQILRETLRQFYVNGGKSQNYATHSRWNAHRENTQFDYEQSYTDCGPSFSSKRQNAVEESSETEDDEEEEKEAEESELELEISEEYMAFLRQNFEYRKARDERKLREAKEEQMKKEEEINDPRPSQDRSDEFKELYGDSWQRIAALDSSLLSEFITLCDSEKPSYWPNIPLRF